MNIFVSRQATIDIEEIGCMISQDNPDAGARVITAIRRAYNNLESYPQLGRAFDSENPHLKDLRVLPTPAYKRYLIIYRVTDRVEIVRILDGARDIEAIFEEPSD